MHAPTSDIKTLQRYAGWLGVLFTTVAAVMSASAGYKFGGEDKIASVSFAILCGGLTFAVAIMLTFVDLAWSAGNKHIAAGLGAFFVLCVFGEYASHVAFGTGHRAANIEAATLQNTRYDDQRKVIADNETSIAFWTQRLAKLEAQNAWVTTQTADALRAKARAEEHRGGCKQKCEAIKAQIALAEEAQDLRSKIDGAKATLAKAREKSARTEKGDSIAMNQSGLFATVATGSLAPSMAAMQWANIAIGAYLSALSTGLGAVFNWLRFHPFSRRHDDDTPSASAPASQSVTRPLAGIPSEPIHVHTVETIKDGTVRDWAQHTALPAFGDQIAQMLGGGKQLKAA